MTTRKWGDLNGINVMGTVVKVYDGDTIHIVAPVGEAGGLYQITCRLDGIDAPELKVNTSAKIALDMILKETEYKVFCNFGKKEKYGRILVKLTGDPSKLSINQRMIDIGEAKEYHGGKK